MLVEAIKGGIYISLAFLGIGLLSLPLGYLCYMHCEGYREKR